ncbi:MerR family DNA-binding transcriptional regulator [Staphylococcus gallinarum]
MTYTIKEASEKMKIPAHTIRYYEKEYKNRKK